MIPVAKWDSDFLCKIHFYVKKKEISNLFFPRFYLYEFSACMYVHMCAMCIQYPRR